MVTLVTDQDYLRTGAAVMTCVVAAVLGVMATVPAVRFLHVVRECVLAMTIGGIGALATVGFEPAIAVARFEYATFVIALAGAFFLVYRLGAGLHGLGRRGVLVVTLGSVILAGTLLYAELLRRYGTPGLVETLLDAVRWSRVNPRRLPAPDRDRARHPRARLGLPHAGPPPPGLVGLRVRRRRDLGRGQLARQPGHHHPARARSRCVYGVVVGLVIGCGVIRLDLALTGPPGGRRGRRARVAEGAAAIRPEPARTHALL